MEPLARLLVDSCTLTADGPIMTAAFILQRQQISNSQLCLQGSLGMNHKMSTQTLLHEHHI